MSKYNIEIGGYTMAPDIIVQEFDFVTAGVYGKIWRYEQMSNEACTASQGKIADEIGINQETLHNKIKSLIDGGYIMDLTPGLRNHPHTFKTTDKLQLQLLLAENPRANANQYAEIREPVRGNPRASTRKSAHCTRKIRDEETDSLRDSLRDAQNDSHPLDLVDGFLKYNKNTEEYKVMEAVTNETGLTPRWKSRTDRDFLSWALGQNEFHARLKTWAHWWKTTDWRGKQGQAPTLTQIQETWHIGLNPHATKGQKVSRPVPEGV